MLFVKGNPTGVMLEFGQLGFFVQVIYFAWIAELGYFSGLQGGNKPGISRKKLAIIPACVSIGFLAYRIAVGNEIVWWTVIPAIAAGVPLSLFLLSVLRRFKGRLRL